MFSFENFRREIKSYLEKNKSIYLVLLLCFFAGLIVGIIIAVSKTSYLGLLNIKDKNFVSLINGAYAPMTLFWKCFSKILILFIIIFLFSLNFYLNILNFVIVIYQSSLLFLSCLAIIQSYNFLGFLKVFLIVLPVNIILFILIFFWIVCCSIRSKMANRLNVFNAGFDNVFFRCLYICLFLIFVYSIIISFVLPLILKSAIFLIF